MFRLRELRKLKNLTMKEFGELFNVSESAISQYETGKRSPDFSTMKNFADFFGVSVDFLLGRNDNATSTSFSPNTISIIGRNGEHEIIELSDQDMAYAQAMLNAIKNKK